MAAPTDLWADPAALRVGSDAELAGLAVRSHLADGRVVAWDGPLAPGERIAIDAELDRAVPAALAARYGSKDFWGRWTRLECRAKLTDTPVVRLLSQLGAPAAPDGIELVTLRLGSDIGPDIVVSIGRV